MAGGVQAADQKQPIKIGAFFALSGPAAPIGTPTKLVAEMAVDQINKAGGINGRPLELIIGDTESDPAKAATIAKKFIHSDKVAAIIGPTSTGEGMQVKKIVEEAGIPIFMTVGGDPPIMKETGPFTYIFKSPQRSSTAIKKLFEYLKEKKMTKVALLTASDPFGKDGAVWLEKLAPDYGITFVAKESFGPKDTDMTPQLTKIKNAAPASHHLLDHRAGRGHRRQKQGPIGHYHPLVPVPRPAGTGIYPTGRQGLRGGPHAVHETDGRGPIAG